jgi:hypothetical protein
MVRALRPHLAVGGPTTAVASEGAPAPTPPPPAPIVRRPVALACVRPVARPARPARAPRPSHGACPPAP